jgi:hypothetical protein
MQATLGTPASCSAPQGGPYSWAAGGLLLRAGLREALRAGLREPALRERLREALRAGLRPRLLLRLAEGERDLMGLLQVQVGECQASAGRSLMHMHCWPATALTGWHACSTQAADMQYAAAH